MCVCARVCNSTDKKELINWNDLEQGLKMKKTQVFLKLKRINEDKNAVDLQATDCNGSLRRLFRLPVQQRRPENGRMRTNVQCGGEGREWRLKESPGFKLFPFIRLLKRKDIGFFSLRIDW